MMANVSKQSYTLQLICVTIREEDKKITLRMSLGTGYVELLLVNQGQDMLLFYILYYLLVLLSTFEH